MNCPYLNRMSRISYRVSLLIYQNPSHHPVIFGFNYQRIDPDGNRTQINDQIILTIHFNATVRMNELSDAVVNRYIKGFCLQGAYLQCKLAVVRNWVYNKLRVSWFINTCDCHKNMVGCIGFTTINGNNIPIPA